ncbi:MAG: acyl--CoA ligase [Candidatus Omnitrophica bacterium]|nr:acyl--CoA ligase [Candidatus Omnitrophota bacterium]
MDVIKILEEKAKTSPHKLALIFKGEGVTFSQLREYSFCLAENLKRKGIGKKDKVAIYLPNCPQYIYSYLAIWCLGATAVPLDFMLTEEELISCIAHSEAKILIAKHKESVSFVLLKEKCPELKEIITCQQKLEGYPFLEELLSDGRPTVPDVSFDEKDYAIIFYTSGTTGRPKGVLTNYRQLGAPPKGMEFFVNFKEEDIFICALPLSHLGGLVYLQNSLVYAIPVVLMERFIPLEFLKNIERFKVTIFWLVPSMYYAILQLKEFETYDLSRLRWIVSFGASNSPEALRRFNQYCPSAHLLNGWGMTETNAPTVVLPMGSKKIESVGRPAPWIEVKIFDENDKELVTGGVGEIVVRSWVITDGYYKDPETTGLTIRDGWFHTGDLGRFDEEGDLYIVGRKKEMIKVGGEIVFEPEIEAALHKHPDIAEAVVVGIPDKLRGEVPYAFIVFKEGKKVSAEDLRYFLRQHLAHFKIPHHFRPVSSLPKTRSGKFDKEQLRFKAGL